VLPQMIIRADNHSHIILADILEMVAAAKAKDLQRYSITEHISQFLPLRRSIEFGSTHESGRLFEDFGEYRREFSKVEGAFPEIGVLKGLEVDYIPRYETKIGEEVNQERWDLLLCSVHELEDGLDIEKKRPGVAGRTLWRAYLDLQTQAVESEFVPFRVLTHPVRMCRGTSDLPDDLDDLLVDLARAAKRKDRALELNGSDLEFSPQLVSRVARACSRATCKVSFGSDAHYPQDVLRNSKLATALVSEFNLEVV
jgi:HisJ family histidinol phosphate phosphatase